MYEKIIKRIIDLCIAIIFLPFLFIVVIVVSGLIILDDGFPVFYNADRIGKNGKPFKMYKFRSMIVNAPDFRNVDGSTYNGIDDPRVTKVGKLLRKTSVDEIPQFINVLLGNMSLIGPRPDPLDDMYIYTDEQKKKLKVKPGITGYNQAYFRNSVIQDEKFENDVFYAEHISFLLDARIFFKTIITVFSSSNIYNKASCIDERYAEDIEKMRGQK